MSLERFLRDTRARDHAGAALENESEPTLAIEVDGGVWLKPGAAIAYRGAIAFERRATLAAPSAHDLLMRETAPLVRAVGRGRLYCAQHGCHAHVVTLADEAIVVAWPNLLAFEQTLQFDLSLLGGALGLAAGGIVGVRLRGTGALALATHGRPLTLPVSAGCPVHADPRATLAWSANLVPVLETDVNWRSVVGHGGHEPIQMRFDGDGYVVVQPFEGPPRLAGALRALRQVARIVTG